MWLTLDTGGCCDLLWPTENENLPITVSYHGVQIIFLHRIMDQPIKCLKGSLESIMLIEELIKWSIKGAVIVWGSNGLLTTVLVGGIPIMVDIV